MTHHGGLPKGLVFYFIFCFVPFPEDPVGEKNKTRLIGCLLSHACSVGIHAELEGAGEVKKRFSNLSTTTTTIETLKKNKHNWNAPFQRAPLAKLCLQTKNLFPFFELSNLTRLYRYFLFSLFFLKQKSKQTLLVLLVKNFNNFFLSLILFFRSID